MLKLCPLFLEGANLYVQIIMLLCHVQHHHCISNLKLDLGNLLRNLPADYVYVNGMHCCFSYHMKTQCEW